MNQWFYAANGEQRGPVDDAGLDALIASGEVVSTTLVWCNGMANWASLAEARPAATGAPPTASGPRCAGCGGAFSEEELVRVQGRACCAACKPVMLQKLQEGVPLALHQGTMLSEEEVLGRGYRMQVSDDLGRAFQTIQADPWSVLPIAWLLAVIGFVALFAGKMIVMVFGLLVAMLGGTAAMIVNPILDGLVQCLVQGAVIGGAWSFFLQRASGLRPGAAVALSGWNSKKLVPLFLVNLWPTLILLGTFLLFGVVVAGLVFAVFGTSGFDPESLKNDPPIPLIVALVCIGIVFVVTLVVLQIRWALAPALVAEKGYGAWEAMRLSSKLVRGHLLGTVWIFLFGGLLVALGAVLCCVGVLFFGPLAYLMWAHHLNRVFGDLAPKA